jgi:CheY-like chemotaxis protein
MLLSGKRIFIVEDDPTNLAVIRTILTKHGAEISFDTWGDAMFDKLHRFQPFHLILLDLALPRGVSGFNIYDQLRAKPEFAGIPVVIVTAADPSTEMNKAREKGLNGFISKPINYHRFAQSIAAVLDGKQVWGDDF